MTTPNPGDRCLTCRRRSTTTICVACRNRAANQLAELPSLLDQLAYAAVGRAAGIHEFVSGGGFGSRPPVALDALTLTATTTMAIGTELFDPQPPTGDEQLSIPLWTHAWAAVWRHRWGHHTPAGIRTEPGPARASNEYATTAPPWSTDPPLAGLPDDTDERDTFVRQVVARRAADLATRMEEHTRESRFRARIVLGLQVARVPDPAAEGGWRRLNDQAGVDDLAEHWLLRFGGHRPVHRLMVDVAYLATWLDNGLDEMDDADLFVVGLRSLVGAGRATVGDRSDVVRLGRCPEPWLDRESGVEEPCGGWLVRDAMVSVVICPRCRTETGEKGLMALAARMREVYGPSARVTS